MFPLSIRFAGELFAERAAGLLGHGDANAVHRQIILDFLATTGAHRHAFGAAFGTAGSTQTV